MHYGETVIVLDIYDKELVRRVVAVEEGIVFVTSPEEFDRATMERREPSCIGFRLSDIVPSKKNRVSRRSA